MINNRQNNRRRGRGGGPRPNGVNPGNDRGNRIDNRARGNANQLYEKYKTLARDAQMQGDRVMSEYYLQFADHYFRVLSESRSRFEDQRPRRDDQNDRDYQEEYGEDNEAGAELSNGSYQPRDYREDQARMNRVEAEAPQDSREPASTFEPNSRDESEDRATAEPVRSGRGRRPRASAATAQRSAPAEEERIEVDRLPPAFAAPEAEEAPVEKPKRRGRRPSAASAVEA